MDTAKVDIRRLQMLNDRINQTIEALNQVRLTVHGISHSSVNPGAPFGGTQFGGGQFAASPYGASPWGVSPFGATPYGVPFGGYPHAPQGFVPGVSHSSPFTGGNLGSPYGYGSVNPVVAQQWGLGMGGLGMGGLGVGGLSHTSPESMSMDPSMSVRTSVGYDPYYVQRVAQTFPFAAWGYSPFSNGIV